MKAKKLVGLFACALAMGVLTSCGNKDAEQKALDKVLNSGIASTTSSGSPLNAETSDNKNETPLKGDDNDALSLTTKQITKVDNQTYTVELEWSFAEEYKDLMSISDIEDDENHKKMSFVYPGESDSNVSASFKVSAKCGSSTDERTFNVLLVKSTIKYEDVKIKDLYKPNSDNTNFDIVNPSTGYIKGNLGQRYYYITVTGKVIYISDDQNWALIADGKDVLQLYHVDLCSDRDVVKVGNYVKVWGNMSNGYGNLQLAFLTKAEIVEDHSDIADFEEQTIPVGLNNKKSSDFKSFFSGISNAVTTFTGTLAADITSFTGLARATFTLNLDGTDNTIVVAYDYHVGTPDKSKLNEAGEAYKAVLSNAKKGKKLTIYGTMRWSSDDGTNSINAKGAWTITPFGVNGIKAA